MIRRFLLSSLALACTQAAPGSAVSADVSPSVDAAGESDVNADPDVGASEDTQPPVDVGPDAPSCSPLEALAGLEAGPISGAAVLGERLYAATRDSLYASDDDGATFTLRHPKSGLSGDIERVQSFGGALWVTAGGRIHRSDDGDTFTETGLPASVWPPTLSTSGGLVLAVQDSRPFRFDEATATFVPLFEGEAPLAALSFVATDGKTFLGDGLVNGGVVRSVDGKTWSQVEALPGWGYQAAFVDGLIQLAANSEAVSRSTDGGQTWEALESAALGSVFRFERGVPLSGPGGSEPRLFAWSVNGLFESADDGLTWAPSTDTLRAQFSDVLEVKGRTVVRDGGNLQVIQGGVPVGLPLPGGLVTSLHPVGDTVAIQDGEGRVRQFHGGAWSPASKVAFIGLGTVDGELLGYINSIVFAGAAAPSNDGPLAFDEVGAFQTYESIGRVFATDTHLFVSSTPWMGDSCGGKGPSALESGGLFRWDGDDQWTQAVGGMPVTQQSCAWGPRYPEPRALIDTGDALLVATVTHGAFRSTNDGDDWSPVTGLPVNAVQLLFATGGGSTVAVDAATATLYREAIPGLFVDEGPVAGLSPSARVTAVALVPGALLVGVTDTARRSADQGLWVSTDDGESFTRVDIAGAGVASLAVAGDTVFVGTAGAGAFRISVSALLAPGEACEAESRAAERGE